MAQVQRRKLQQGGGASDDAMWQCDRLSWHFNAIATRQLSPEESHSLVPGIVALLEASTHDARSVPYGPKRLSWRIVGSVQRLEPSRRLGDNSLARDARIQRAVSQALAHAHRTDDLPVTDGSTEVQPLLSEHVAHWAAAQEHFAVHCEPFWQQVGTVLRQDGAHVLDFHAALALLSAASAARIRGDAVSAQLAQQLARAVLALADPRPGVTVKLVACLYPWADTDVPSQLPRSAKDRFLQLVTDTAPQISERRRPSFVRQAGAVASAVTASELHTQEALAVRTALVALADTAMRGTVVRPAQLIAGLSTIGAFDGSDAACERADDLATSLTKQQAPIPYIVHAAEAISLPQVSDACQERLRSSVQSSLRALVQLRSTGGRTIARLLQLPRTPEVLTADDLTALAQSAQQRLPRISQQDLEVLVAAAAGSSNEAVQALHTAADEALRSAGTAEAGARQLLAGWQPPAVVPHVARFVDADPEAARAATSRALTDPASLTPIAAQATMCAAELLRLKLDDSEARAVVASACNVGEDAPPLAVINTWGPVAKVLERAVQDHTDKKSTLFRALRAPDGVTLPPPLRQLLAATPQALRDAADQRPDGRIDVKLLARVAHCAATAVPALRDTSDLRAMADLYDQLHVLLARSALSMATGAALNVLDCVAMLESALPRGGASEWVAPVVARVVPRTNASALRALATSLRQLYPSMPAGTLAAFASRVLAMSADARHSSPRELRRGEVVDTLSSLICLLPADKQLCAAAELLSEKAHAKGASRSLSLAAYVYAYAAANGRGAALPPHAVVAVLQDVVLPGSFAAKSEVRCYFPRSYLKMY